MDKLVVSGEEFSPVMNEILSTGGTVSLVVSGSSMLPFLKHGRDTVNLCRCTARDLKWGQILLFRRLDQSLVLHRIRKILPDGRLLMNGDGQKWCEMIFPAQVIAYASSVERKGRLMPCNRVLFRFWNLIWYPTRPFRPMLFQIGRILFRRRKRQ